jgi:hypothetical protein
VSARWVKMTDRGPWHRMGSPAGNRVTILCRDAPVDFVARLVGGFPPDGEPFCDQCVAISGDDSSVNT